MTTRRSISTQAYPPVNSIHIHTDIRRNEQFSPLTSTLTSVSDDRHSLSGNEKLLDSLDPSFMYTQLLKDIARGTTDDTTAKAEFIEYWRQHYTHNDQVQSTVNQFEQDSIDHSTIWWYTKEYFIYSTLNRALRTQDIKVSWKMRFFIKNLHREIENIHSQTLQDAVLILYRGYG